MRALEPWERAPARLLRVRRVREALGHAREAPLHTVNAHPNERAMAVDFHGPDRVVSGGTDGKLRTFKIARPEALDDAAGDDEDDA